MPKYPGGKYGADMAERGGHQPMRAEAETQMPKGKSSGHGPAKKVPMPEMSVAEVMAASNHAPWVTGTETQVKGGVGKGPAKKVPMAMPDAGKEVG